MGQILHGSAATTQAIRRAIQSSQESLRALAGRYGINQKTVAKWKKRSSVADLPTGPKEPKSTVLSIEEEAVIVAFRRHTLLPLDDCLYALQPTIPKLTRSSLHRCLQRHGIAWRDNGPIDSLIHWQRYDAAGVKVGNEITVTSSDSGDQSLPSIVQLASGNLWIVNQDFDAVGDDDIDGKIYTLAGAFVGSQQPNVSSLDQHQNPATASLGANGSVAVYYDNTNGGGNIVMRGFNAAGLQSFAEATVNTNAGSLAAIQHDSAGRQASMVPSLWSHGTTMA
jgi:hypothetical protein